MCVIAKLTCSYVLYSNHVFTQISGIEGFFSQNSFRYIKRVRNDFNVAYFKMYDITSLLFKYIIVRTKMYSP